MTKRDVCREKHRLLEFCKTHNHVYLYGAGTYGKKYYEILQSEGLSVSGFITTKGAEKKYLGLPVYGVKEACELLTGRDGIIPAYRGCSPEEIERNFTLANPAVLTFDHKVILWLENEKNFLPIANELGKEFPVMPLVNCSEWKNILVIRLDVIGDLVCTTAFIRELKRNYPHGIVSVIITEQMEPLLKNCPYIDKLILYEANADDLDLAGECANYELMKKKIIQFAAIHFNGKHFDAVFLPGEALLGKNRIDALLMAAYSGADCRIGRVVGFDDYRNWVYDVLQGFFTQLYYQTEERQESEYMLDLLRECGLQVVKEEKELWPDENCRKLAETTLKENGIQERDKLIAVGLVGSVPVKTWKVENYKELIHNFYAKYGISYKFLLFGGKDAMETASQMSDHEEIIVNFAGRLSLDMTVACMERCSLYIGSDTGLLHIATAVGKPSVVLYRTLEDETDKRGAGPWRWGAGRKDSIALLPPAGLEGCHGVCQKSYSHCINQIRPFQVLQAMENILDRLEERVSPIL